MCLFYVQHCKLSTVFPRQRGSDALFGVVVAGHARGMKKGVHYIVFASHYAPCDENVCVHTKCEKFIPYILTLNSTVQMAFTTRVVEAVLLF